MKHFCSPEANGTFTLSGRLGGIICEYRVFVHRKAYQKFPKSPLMSTVQLWGRQTLPELCSSYVAEGPAEVGIFTRRNCGQLYMSVQGIKLKSKLQHTETWSAAARPSRCQWYRPSVFFRHLRTVSLGFYSRKEKYGTRFKNIVSIFLLKKSYLGLKLHKSGSVCTRIKEMLSVV
jgi:hypothetical protein